MTLLFIIDAENLTNYPILINEKYERLAANVHRKSLQSLEDNQIYNLLGGNKGLNISPELGEVLDDDKPHYLELDAIYWLFYE